MRTGSDCGFSKILRFRTGLNSISSDQDWTRTEKFHSPYISVPHVSFFPTISVAQIFLSDLSDISNLSDLRYLSNLSVVILAILL